MYIYMCSHSAIVHFFVNFVTKFFFNKTNFFESIFKEGLITTLIFFKTIVQ